MTFQNYTSAAEVWQTRNETDSIASSLAHAMVQLLNDTIIYQIPNSEGEEEVMRRDGFHVHHSKPQQLQQQRQLFKRLLTHDGPSVNKIVFINDAPVIHNAFYDVNCPGNDPDEISETTCMVGISTISVLTNDKVGAQEDVLHVMESSMAPIGEGEALLSNQNAELANSGVELFYLGAGEYSGVDLLPEPRLCFKLFFFRRSWLQITK